MAGNRLGPRAKITYESETPGVVYILQTDADFIVAGAGVGAAAPDVYNPATPIDPNVMVCPPPKRFKPRGVYLQSSDGNSRKFLVCTSQSADLYATSTIQSVSIDGETFFTTGRRGETQTF